MAITLAFMGFAITLPTSGNRRQYDSELKNGLRKAIAVTGVLALLAAQTLKNRG
ncbi:MULTISPECIES: hypothetical protein [unclassified Anabaena]|uniref:hypothetical protein n=1 Tax=unclassified Anabaena TaxID=2619674 RepID=UPI001446D85A|nr:MULTISPECIES: hypothetical protein [unclassified Anabaena]